MTGPIDVKRKGSDLRCRRAVDSSRLDIIIDMIDVTYLSADSAFIAMPSTRLDWRLSLTWLMWLNEVPTQLSSCSSFSGLTCSLRTSSAWTWLSYWTRTMRYSTHQEVVTSRSLWSRRQGPHYGQWHTPGPLPTTPCTRSTRQYVMSWQWDEGVSSPSLKTKSGHYGNFVVTICDFTNRHTHWTHLMICLIAASYYLSSCTDKW